MFFLVILILIAVVCTGYAGYSIVQEKRAENNKIKSDQDANAQRAERLHRIQEIVSSPLYAWFDPKYAEEVGTSFYTLADGTRVEVTHISNNPLEFRHRQVTKQMKYIGAVTKFFEHGRIGPFFLNNNIEISDVAMLCLLYPDVFDRFYRFNERINNHFEPISAEQVSPDGSIIEI